MNRFKEKIIIFPSDASMNVYSKNTASNFTTELPNYENFNSSTEVALVEAIFPKHLLNVPNNQRFILQAVNIEKQLNTSTHISRIFQKGKYSSYTFLIEEIKKLISEVEKNTLENKFKKKIADLEKTVEKNVDLNITALPIFELKNERFVEMKLGSMTVNIQIGLSGIEKQEWKLFWNFGSYLIKMLGFPEKLNTNIVLTDGIIKSISPIDLNGQIHNFYIYTNLIKPVIVGNVKAKVLRVIGVDSPINDRSSDQEKIVLPLYLPLSQLSFNTVEFSIRDDTGEFVKFESGKVVLTLIFREYI